MLLDQHKMAGWVVEVWESQEAADAYFEGETWASPKKRRCVVGQPDTFTVYNVIPAAELPGTLFLHTSRGRRSEGDLRLMGGSKGLLGAGSFREGLF
jgi:hypothetical protein